MSYPIDGVVFKYDDLSLRDSLGSTAHHLIMLLRISLKMNYMIRL